MEKNNNFSFNHIPYILLGFGKINNYFTDCIQGETFVLGGSHNSCLIENKVLIPSSHNIPAVRHETNSYSLEIGARKSNSMWNKKNIKL